MFGYTYGSIEDIEIVWTLVAALGLGYSLLNIRDAKIDLSYLREMRVINGRLLVAKANLLTESLRAVIQAIFLVIGLLAMTLVTSTPDNLSWNQLAISMAVRWGLITASILLTAKTIIARRLRKQVVEWRPRGH